MSAIEDLISAYREVLETPWPRQLAGAERVWFAVYDPAQERRLRIRFNEFEAATLQAGHTWSQLDLTDAFARWMAAQEYRDAYFDQPELMTFALSGFRDALIREIRDLLQAPLVDGNAVVAISGLASIFGLVRASEVIGQITDEIRGRLLVFFPGHYDLQNYYRLLDARDGWDYLATPILAKRQ